MSNFSELIAKSLVSRVATVESDILELDPQASEENVTLVFSAIHPPAPFSAINTDETTDNTVVLQALLNHIGATMHGGLLDLPGINIVVSDLLVKYDNISIRGVPGQTVLKPANNSVSCLKLGDGVSVVNRFSMEGVDFLGIYNDPTMTGDGIVINGLYDADIRNCKITRFRDNIHITSSATAITSKIRFSSITSNEPNRYGIFIEQGGSWATAVSFQGYMSFLATAAAGKSMYNNNCGIEMVNTYFDTLKDKGFVFVGTDAQIWGTNINIDNGSSGRTESDVIIETSLASSTWYVPTVGVRFSNYCAIKYSDAVVIPIRTSTALLNKTKMVLPIVYSSLRFSGYQNIDPDTAVLPRIYNDTANSLFRFDGGNNRIRLEPKDGIVEIKDDDSTPYLMIIRGSDQGQIYLASGDMYLKAGTTGKHVRFPKMDFDGGHIMLGSDRHLYLNSTGNRLRLGSSATEASNFTLATYINAVPASPTATGTPGDEIADANYFYKCIATNTWVRFAKDAAWV